MSTMEKLFAQIFERKKWIVEQVKHQAHLFDQHLASTLLIDGIAPPPWLLHSYPSDGDEFQKEELISELLFPCPQYPIPRPSSRFSAYEKPIFTADHREFRADSFCTGPSTSHIMKDASNELSLLPVCPLDDSRCVLDGAAAADPAIRSPQHDTNEIISGDYHGLDQSLARVQRSKTRQKALEIRNSAKASGSSSLCQEADIHPGGTASSGIALQLSENVLSKKLVENSTTNSSVCAREEETQVVNSESEVKGGKTSIGRRTGSLISSSKSAQPDIGIELARSNNSGLVARNDVVAELVQQDIWIDHSVKSNGSCRMHSNEGKVCQINAHEATVDSGKILQSSCSFHQPNNEKLPISENSDFGDRKMASSLEEVMQLPDDGNGEACKKSLILDCSANQSACTGSDQPVIASTDDRLKLSNTTQDNQPNIRTNVDPKTCAVEAAQPLFFSGKPAQGSFPIKLSINASYHETVPEVLASSLESDSNVFLKPKQLDFDDIMENRDNINEVPATVLEERIKGKDPSKEPVTLLESENCATELDFYTNLSEDPVGKAGRTSISLGLYSESLVSETRGINKKSNCSLSFKDHSTNFAHDDILVHPMNDGGDVTTSRRKFNARAGSSQQNDREFSVAKSIEADIPDKKSHPEPYGGQVMLMKLTESTSKSSPHYTQTMKRSINSHDQGCENLMPQPKHDKPTDVLSGSSSLGNNEGSMTSSVEGIQRTSISSMDRCLDNSMQRDVENHVTDELENLQMQQVGEGDVNLEKCTSASSYLIQESHGRPSDSVIFGPSGILTDERDEGIDKKHQYQAADTFEQMDEEHLTCSGRSGHDGEFSAEGKYQFIHLYDGCKLVEPVGVHESMPVFEGFVMQTDDDEQLPISEGEFNCEKLAAQDANMETDTVLELLRKSAPVHTPSSHFSTGYNLQKTSYFNKSSCLIEHMDLTCALPLNESSGVSSFFGKEVEQVFYERSHPDCLRYSGAESAGGQRKPYTSPVGKLWDIIASTSGSSREKSSLNPELPCISEENENADEVADTSMEGTSSEVKSEGKRKPLADITEDPNYPASVSDTENEMTRCSLDSIKTEISISGMPVMVKQKPRGWKSSNKANNSKTKPRGLNGVKRPMELPKNRFSKPKASLRKGGPGISELSKRDNIVCNMTSFLPLVQQKQGAAPFTGKRDIKVKALEAAEAAKRQADKKEIERKMKKEALKLERARVEEENRRQLELQRKRKEEEQKKKLADMAMKKRLRGEEERREKERKRKRVEDTRRIKEEHQEACAKREQQGQQFLAAEGKESERHIGMNETTEEGRWINEEQIPNNEAAPDRGIVFEPCGTERNYDDNTKAISTLHEARHNECSGNEYNHEESYEISPYKCSDDEDEDEEEDDTPNTKFVPSWASKNHLSQVIFSQQRVDPDVIFPPNSFCSISEAEQPNNIFWRFQDQDDDE